MFSDFSELTLVDFYSKSIIDFSDRPAFSFVDKERLTYREFGERVENVTGIFNKYGLEKGDKIAILSNNMPNWPVSYFAITTSSRVAVTILPDFTAFEIVNILEHSEAKALIVSKKLQYKIPKHIFQKLSLIISIDNLEIIKSPQEDNYVLPEEPNPEDLAALIYTSGTSGSPKGVMLSHSNLVSHTVLVNVLFPIYKEDVFLSILPLSHAYECSIGMILPFTYGAHVVYLDGAPSPSTLIPALQIVRPTIILSVPLIVEKIFKNKIRPIFSKNFPTQVLYSISFIRRALHKIAGKKLLRIFGGNLRFFGIGGSKLDCMVEKFLADAGFPYSIGYGLTETSPLIAGAIPGKVILQSTGPGMQGIEIKILNPDKKKTGEIVVKGPNVMMGYYKDEKTTTSCFTEDGWFRTKDLGYIDKKGNLFIKGRKDNMISGPSGENIYPEEIESIINEHDLVLESLVTMINGKLVAIVYFNFELIETLYQLSDKHTLSMDERVKKIKTEVMEFVNDKVNKASKIQEIIEQDIPFEKTATQKIKRYLYV